MDFNAIGWFEVPTKDMDRAITFYEAVLGHKLEVHDMPDMKMAWFPWEEGKKGAAGSLVQTEGYTPSHDGTVIYFTVNSVEETSKKVEPAGGKILLPKKDIGEYGFIAHIEDTEGNRVAIHSREG